MGDFLNTGMGKPIEKKEPIFNFYWIVLTKLKLTQKNKIMR